MRFYSLLALILGLYSALATANGLSPQCQEFQALFPRIRFEVQHRGGFGDVAAAYMNAQALLAECPPAEKMQLVLPDYKARAVLQKLMESHPEFESQVEILVDDRRGPIRELIIHPAIEGLSNIMPPAVSESVRMYIPVFSDSESELGYGEIFYRDIKLRTAVPGLRIDQSGTYPDLVAKEFKDMSRDQILERLMVLSGTYNLDALRSVLESAGRFTLAYGISSYQADLDFKSYLSRLADMPSDRPIVVLTPSRALDTIERILKVGNELPGNIQKMHLKDLAGSWQPKAGQVHVIETPNLPHAIFVGLMALSVAEGIVPLGAGDGFISSAIELGIPFGLTHVYHNKSVIRDYERHLSKWTIQNMSPERRKPLINLILNNLRTQGAKRSLESMNVQKFMEFKDEFAKFSASIKRTMTEWMENAIHIKKNYETLSLKPKIPEATQIDMGDLWGTYSDNQSHCVDLLLIKANL